MRSAKLFILGEERELLWVDTNYYRHTSVNGSPTSDVEGGVLTLGFVTQENDATFLHNMTKEVKKETERMEAGEIHFYSKGDEDFPVRKYKFRDAYLTYFSETFYAFSSENMQTILTISPAIQDYGSNLVKHWQVSQISPSEQAPYQPIKEKEKKKQLVLTFYADKKEVLNGVFGFDKFDKDFKKICISDIIKLENEYNPFMIDNEKYFPVWVSIRKGQTITLKLDTLKKENYKEFKEITFQKTSDFTFEPVNLKDAKEVKITCNNSNPETLQLKIDGDGETVGAINFFYPESKTLALDWRFVEVMGNGMDKKKLSKIITVEKLNKFFKKSFNPLLIDIKIENSETNIADLTLLKDEMEKTTEVIVFNQVEKYYYINDLRKSTFVAYTQRENKSSETALTMYFINMRCIKPSEVTKSLSGEAFSLIGGFSPTGTGTAYGVLDSGDTIKEENIIHELLHAVGLHHTFEKESKHQFKFSKTNDYMDYNNSKEVTYYWQWQIVQDWIKANSQFTR
ncbi:hypothetical protein LNQ49_19985 [Flavobacterium sp. F-65]|uniref:Metallo-peptidase family M12B Reprolysin-like n=1 Tax=Flavobacterium pisciphilum TaxID=2893755 RepID=A0ABS8MYK4_9FLAO|nr:type VI secretion system tube protein TssD [Flavobacterium sp. F-65]MCC9073868.1 hypothetical protein [Flavobacterium sp. F-65]